MPGIIATPPVNTVGGSVMRPAMADTRVTIAFCTPATMSSGRAFAASSPMISVSAKTTHMLLMTAGSALRPARSPS